MDASVTDDKPHTADELYKRYLAKYPKYLSDIAYIRMIKKELTST